jgi:hypothetical protein|tara:strand:+ start:623 stop:835 length:213 start_codon:yes stop_codon:yes gene_type:complete
MICDRCNSDKYVDVIEYNTTLYKDDRSFRYQECVWYCTRCEYQDEITGEVLLNKENKNVNEQIQIGRELS